MICLYSKPNNRWYTALYLKLWVISKRSVDQGRWMIFWREHVESDPTESLKPSKVINAVTAIKFSVRCCFFLGPWYSSTLVDLWLFVLSKILGWKQLHLYQSLLLLLCRNPDRVFFFFCLFLLRIGKECSIWYSNKEKKKDEAGGHKWVLEKWTGV